MTSAALMGQGEHTQACTATAAVMEQGCLCCRAAGWSGFVTVLQGGRPARLAPCATGRHEAIMQCTWNN